MKNLNYYAEIFSQLNRGKNTHTHEKELSPYKPIFLLSIIELIDKGVIAENKIYTNKNEYRQLKETFQIYQKLIGGAYKDKKSVLCQPFFNLINDKHTETEEPFWHLYLNSNVQYSRIEDITDSEGRNRIKSETKLKEIIEYASFDKNLWDILQDSEARNYLTQVLITNFFSERINELDSILITINENSEQQMRSIAEPKNSNKKIIYKKSLVRDSLFSRSITYIYQYQCAVCRMTMKTSGQKNYKYIVEAAHIIPFAISNNNRLSNGVSLCKNHHWAFDNGCFSIEPENYTTIVSDKFEEQYCNTRESLSLIPLRQYHGYPILLPQNPQYYPNREALIWHRNKHCI